MTKQGKEELEGRIIELLNHGELSAKLIAEKLQFDERKIKYYLSVFVKDKNCPITAKGSTSNRTYYIRKKPVPNRTPQPPRKRKMKEVRVSVVQQPNANDRPMFNRLLSLMEAVWQSGK